MINIKKSIDNIIATLIEKGLVCDQNFTATSDNEVRWSGNNDISICLKNIDYRDIYYELNKNRNYNMKFIDGSIIQLQYKFNSDNSYIKEHRLAYFPSPLLKRYNEEENYYDPMTFEEDIYSDIIDEFIITTPIRIDYNPSQFIDDEHPVCHMHFGQIEGCRIPVGRAIYPDEFIKFILKNFYNKFFIKYLKDYKFEVKKLNYTITEKEQKNIHINIS